MVFPAPPPLQFQASGESKSQTEKPDRSTEPTENELIGKMEENGHLEAELGFPPPPGVPPHLPWPPPQGPSRPLGGAQPDFMGARPRAPFGPHGGFPVSLPLRPGVRLGRSNVEEPGMGDGEHGDLMDEEEDMQDSGFSGLGRSGVSQNFPNSMRGAPPPWFDFRGGPRGPPGPQGMRIPGPPRFPFEERGMGIGRPPFRTLGPPSLMGGDDQRFNSPPIGFRGRPPFPPGEPRMQNFGGHPMEPPFNRFGDGGPRPLFHRGFGFPGAAGKPEYYDENLEENLTELEEDRPESQEEEEWKEDAAGEHFDVVRGQRQERRLGERDHRENTETDWSSGSRGENNRVRNQWMGQGHRSLEDGEDDLGRGHRRRDEGVTSSVNNRQKIQHERPDPDRSEESNPSNGRSRDPFSSTAGETAALREPKTDSPLPGKTEKKPRKTRWSSAVEQSATDQSTDGFDVTSEDVPLEQAASLPATGLQS